MHGRRPCDRRRKKFEYFRFNFVIPRSISAGLVDVWLVERKGQRERKREKQQRRRVGNDGHVSRRFVGLSGDNEVVKLVGRRSLHASRNLDGRIDRSLGRLGSAILTWRNIEARGMYISTENRAVEKILLQQRIAVFSYQFRISLRLDGFHCDRQQFPEERDFSQNFIRMFPPPPPEHFCKGRADVNSIRWE